MKAARPLIAIIYLVLFGLSVAASANLLAVPLSDAQWYLHKKSGPYELIDFSQFYQAGQLAVGPSAHRVYEPEVQNQWACALVAPNVPDKIFYNQSVPFLYVLMIPYGWLSYSRAYVAWCLSTLVLAAASLYLLVSREGQLKGASRLVFIAGVFSSIASYLTIWHGQSTFLLTAAFAFMALFLMQKRQVACAFALALTTFKPQYLLPFIALLGGLGRIKTILALFVFEAVLMAVAAIFIGVENIVNYPRVLTGAESSSHFIGVNPHYMVSVRGLLSNIMPHKTAMLVTVGALIAALPPLALAAARTQKASAADKDKLRWLVALTFTVALIFSPHSHYFDCLLLAVPAALTLPTLDLAALISGRESAASLKLPHRIWCIMLILYPLASWPLNFMPSIIPGGSRELEGVFFMVINLTLLVLSALMCGRGESGLDAEKGS